MKSTKDSVLFWNQGEHRLVAQADSEVVIRFEVGDEQALAFSVQRHGLLTRATCIQKD